MKIQDTDAWKAAEWRYSSIQAALMVPFPGLARSPSEIIEELEEIVHECLEFYPAVLELGLRRMAGGVDGSEAEQIETGLRLMLDVGDPLTHGRRGRRSSRQSRKPVAIRSVQMLHGDFGRAFSR